VEVAREIMFCVDPLMTNDRTECRWPMMEGVGRFRYVCLPKIRFGVWRTPLFTI